MLSRDLPLTVIRLALLMLAAAQLSACAVSSSTMRQSSERAKAAAGSADDYAIGPPAELIRPRDEPITDPWENVDGVRLAVRRTGDLWERLRAGLTLPRDRVEVRDSARQLAMSRRHLNETFQRGQLYLWHMVQEVEARGMPIEIALLPAIESAYNPNAYSPSHAVGLWQFLSGTGDRFGLRRNWWYDGRRDVTESTRAALDYLSYLYEMFGDWALALAAYNSGEGRVQQALQNNRARGMPADFWSISLPNETRNYVPRLLGLAELLSNPAQYGYELAPLPDEPRFEVVELPSQIELELAADLINLDLATLRSLNAGYSRWATDPQGPHRLLVPYGKGALMQERVAALPTESLVRWHQYVVQEGDSLSSIARSYGVQADLLQEMNNLPTNLLIAGTELRIPKVGEGDAAWAEREAQADLVKVTHVIRPGDSLYRIANLHGVQVKDLVSLNKLNVDSILRPGRTLTVRHEKKVPQRPSTRKTNAPAQPAVYYIVQWGDSLSQIAQQFNVSVNDLQQWNKLPDDQSIRAGQRLRVKEYSPGTTGT